MEQQEKKIPPWMQLLDDLAEVIGQQALIELLLAWGGYSLYVPMEIPQDHPIALRIGPYNANALAAYCGGCTLDLPRYTTTTREKRNRAVIDQLAAGKSVGTVAREFGLSERWIRELRKSLSE